LHRKTSQEDLNVNEYEHVWLK